MKYFTIKELCHSTTADRLHIDNTPNQEQLDNLTALVSNVLDPVRELLGRPIKVNSGFRSPELNKKVGGSKTSQHMKGQAADITCYDNRKLFELLQTMEFDQLIDEYNLSWVHISFRNDGTNRHQILKIT